MNCIIIICSSLKAIKRVSLCGGGGGGGEQNREEVEMAQTKLGGGRSRGGGSREEGEKEKLTFREEGEIGSKSREEGEIGSESREKGDLTPCSTPLSVEAVVSYTCTQISFCRQLNCDHV